MGERDEVDAVVIGAGQGGSPLAKALAGKGRRTVLVERQAVGGSCVNHGCTPTKTLVASARVAHLARRSAEFGVESGSVRVDLAEAMRRKDRVVRSFREGLVSGIEATDGLELLRGTARFTGPRALEVRLASGGVRRLHAREVSVNTGSRPARPPLEGLGDVAALDSTSILELAELPRRLLVLGGGYVGLEFGQMFRRFGSEVAIVHRGRHLLSREDEDVAEALAEVLAGEGIELHLETAARRVEGEGDGVALTVSGARGERVLEGSHLLVAAGRAPSTRELGLDAAKVATDDEGFIRVNERLETTAQGVWALGDVKGGPAFTHVSYDDYRLLQANLLEGGDRTTRDRLACYAVFTDPELGRVGLSEHEARRAGRDVRVAKLPMSSVARAIETGETRGLLKAVVDRASGLILGCACLGLEGGELMSMIAIAMMGRLPYTALRDGVFAHPTRAEALNSLFGSFAD